MYASPLSVSELNRSQNPSRNRTLHGSQSHHNLQMSSNMNGFHEGFGSSTSPQQYIPGYLMSASQGMPPPSSPQQFNMPPLETKDTLRHGASYSSFGSESLLGMPRPSPKGRSPRVPPTIDDENAPPTASLMDSGVGNFEVNNTRLLHRHSIGGFHPHAPSPLAASASNSNNQEQDNSQAPSNSYPITVFGFTADQRRTVVNSFLSMSSTAQVDYPENEVANWVTITYPEETEALRAIRRNGEVLQGATMIGVRWADDRSTDSHSMNQSTSTITSDFGALTSPRSHTISHAGQTGFASSGRSLTLKPSSSAFRKDNRATTGNTGRATGTAGGDGGDWGIIEYQKQQAALKGQPEQPPGIVGQVNRLLFGW